MSSPSEPVVLLRVSTKKPPELKSYADLASYACSLSPADILYAPTMKTVARMSNQSTMRLVRSVTGLSRSQLLRGVTKRSTLQRAERHATRALRNKLRKDEWTEAEIDIELAALPTSRYDVALPLADLTHSALRRFGGGMRAVQTAMNIDRLALNLQHAYEQGTPVQSILNMLRAPAILGSDFFSHPTARLTKDPHEQGVIDALETAESWADVSPFVCFLSVHCTWALLAAIDVCVTAQLREVWDVRAESVVTRLFPRLSSRAQTDTGRPTRRGLMETPFANLLDLTVELIHKLRTNTLPKRRVPWKDVEAWTSISAGQLAKWRSGETPMSADEYQQFWRSAMNRQGASTHVPPAPMALFFAAAMIETSCVVWRRPGRIKTAIIPDAKHFLIYRRIVDEADEPASS